MNSEAFLKLNDEYKELKLKYEQLNRLYKQLVVKGKQDKILIESLKSELFSLKPQSAITSKSTLQVSPPGKYEQLSLFSPKPARKFPGPSEIMSPSQSSGKTPQANPDQSVNSDQTTSFIFQAFFIVGIGKNQLGSFIPDILFEYSPDTASISSGVRKVLPDLCFPTGASARKLKLSGSASDLNRVLYSQVPLKRNHSCFLFTLRAEEVTSEPPHPDFPNSEQELIYFTCIAIDDLCVDSKGIEWVVPKCYVVASYIPVLDLHFEFLRSLLLIKRLYRTNLIASDDNDGISSLVENECCNDEILQINCYASCVEITPEMTINIGIEKIEQLRYFFPSDLSTVDLVWLCVPLFTSLKFQDFFWLLSAILQEKSVVFISSNLGLLSSCVLCVNALLRPFKWPNLMVPIIPNSLRELLDAPVPLIAGVPDIGTLERQNYSNIIWVLLDEPNLNRKIQGTSSIVQEVIEPEAPQLKRNLLELYRVYEGENHKFVGTADEKMNCCVIAGQLKLFYVKIIDAFKGVTLNEQNLTNILVKKFPIYDHKFIRAFTQTLMFNNKISQAS